MFRPSSATAHGCPSRRDTARHIPPLLLARLVKQVQYFTKGIVGIGLWASDFGPRKHSSKVTHKHDIVGLAQRSQFAHEVQ